MRFTKYEKMGDYHWRQYDKNTKYKRHADKVRDWVKEKDVLDIGAGDGKITDLLGAVGIDNEEAGVEIANSKGVEVILGDAYAMPFFDEQFDSAVMIDVLEHFEFPEKALKEAKRVLRNYLYIATPPKDIKPGELLDKFHYQEWSPRELKELMLENGFKLEGKIEVVLENKCMYGKFKKL
jgi:ubiquinone/menaquinone biosynthesis C-methylase UbiE